MCLGVDAVKDGETIRIRQKNCEENHKPGIAGMVGVISYTGLLSRGIIQRRTTLPQADMDNYIGSSTPTPSITYGTSG